MFDIFSRKQQSLSSQAGILFSRYKNVFCSYIGNVWTAKGRPQNKITPLFSKSPYAVSKLSGIWTVRTYKEAYKLFMLIDILFNHESVVRGPEFVTSEISKSVANLNLNSKEQIVLGNLSAVKDRRYAKDYVYGIRMML